MRGSSVKKMDSKKDGKKHSKPPLKLVRLRTKKSVRPILSIVPFCRPQSVPPSRKAPRVTAKPALWECLKKDWVNWLLSQKRFD
jgi:hypothetical protein